MSSEFHTFLAKNHLSSIGMPRCFSDNYIKNEFGIPYFVGKKSFFLYRHASMFIRLPDN